MQDSHSSRNGGLLDTLDALYRETTAGTWETRFFSGGRSSIAYEGGFLLPTGPDSHTLTSADLCFIVEMRRNWPEIRDRLRAALSETAATDVWAVSNKTSFALFATEDDAQKYVSGFPASVGGGMHINKMPVFRVGVIP